MKKGSYRAKKKDEVVWTQRPVGKWFSSPTERIMVHGKERKTARRERDSVSFSGFEEERERNTVKKKKKRKIAAKIPKS